MKCNLMGIVIRVHYRIDVLLLLFVSIVICSSSAVGADNTLIDELSETLSSFRKNAEFNIEPKGLKRTVVGFWGPESWAEPFLDKNRRVDPRKLSNGIDIVTGNAVGNREKSLYQLYKTLPYIHDLHESSLGRDMQPLRENWPELAKTQERLFEFLGQPMGIENPFKVKGIDPLTLKQNVILLLQKARMLPDYKQSFTKAQTIIKLVNLQLEKLNGSEPPEVKRHLEAIAKGVEQTTEFLALQYVSTMYQGGPFSSESESYLELQSAIQKAIVGLTAKLGEAAIAPALSSAKEAIAKDIEKHKKNIMSKAAIYSTNLFYGEDYNEEFSGLNGLIDSMKSIRGSRDALSGLAGDLNKQAEELSSLYTSYQINLAKYEQERQEYTNGLLKKLKDMSKDGRQKFISDKMQKGHSSMHAGDYLGAARYYEAASIAESRLDRLEKFKHGLDGSADPKDYIVKALNAILHPTEYDLYYEDLRRQLDMQNTKPANRSGENPNRNINQTVKNSVQQPRDVDTQPELLKRVKEQLIYNWRQYTWKATVPNWRNNIHSWNKTGRYNPYKGWFSESCDSFSDVYKKVKSSDVSGAPRLETELLDEYVGNMKKGNIGGMVTSSEKIARAKGWEYWSKKAGVDHQLSQVTREFRSRYNQDMKTAQGREAIQTTGQMLRSTPWDK